MLIKRFQLEDRHGNMQELSQVTHTIKVQNYPPLSDHLLPLFGHRGYELLPPSSKGLVDKVRHHGASKYESEWNRLRMLPHVKDATWHVMAFALSAQCAAESALFMDSIGMDKQICKIHSWLNEKAREHGKWADITGIDPMFLGLIKEMVRANNMLYLRSDGDYTITGFWPLDMDTLQANGIPAPVPGRRGQPRDRAALVIESSRPRPRPRPLLLARKPTNPGFRRHWQ